MGLFGNPRNKKDKWAKLVVANAKPGMDFDEEFLDAATTMYIQQHTRILYDSIRLVLNSKNENTRKERFKLAQEKFGALVAIKKYANKEQKKEINRALDDFLKMEDMYKHPGKKQNAAFDKKKQLKEDFWEVYAQGEMLDIFSGKKK